MRTRSGLLAVCCFGVALPLAATGATARKGVSLSQEVTAKFAGPVRAGDRLVVPRLTLDDGSAVALDLEVFDVFAPDAAIIEHTDSGLRRLPLPRDSYFRGTIVGDPGSMVVLISGTKLRGFVQTNGNVYAIAPDRDVYADDRDEPVSRLRRIDPEGDRPAGLPPFRCGVDSLPGPMGGSPESAALGVRTTAQPLFTNTVYTVKLALETDYEFYQLFGSTDGAVRFLGDLTAAASAIYLRDVKAVFQIGTIHLYSTSSNPWNGSYGDTSALLYALGDYWHANYPSVSRTTVHMLSGKDLGGGVAYLSALCSGDVPYGGHWGGGYGVSASLSAQFSTTNPNLYWDILCYTHEIGHNFSSPHTECYAPPVDTCTPCNSFSCTGSVPSGGGTIMSYCHACNGGYSNIILYFGLAGQASQAVTDVMRGYVEGIAPCLLPYAAQPTVGGFSPAVGPPAGGTPVTISGTGFQSYATVRLGGVPATGVSVVSSTSITATTGAHAGGTVNVVVVNPDNQSGTLSNGYFYGACPVPGTPALSGPGSGTSGVAYTVSWSATSGDNTYELQESTDSGFAVTDTTPVTGTSLAIVHTALSAKTYYYRVRATVLCSASAVTSAWSSPVSVSVSAGLACAVNLSSLTISTAQEYVSCGLLTAGPAVQVASSGQSRFRAATAVVLRNGFSVQSGARFRAGVDPSLALMIGSTGNRAGNP